MRLDVKLDRMVHVGAALCAGLASLGGIDNDGACSFRMASRFHGITPEFSLNSVRVALRQGRVEISPQAGGSVVTADQMREMPDSIILHAIEHNAANSLDFNTTATLLRVAAGPDSNGIPPDTLVEWTFDQTLQSSGHSDEWPNSTADDITFTSVWSLTAQPAASPTMHTVILQVCCITGNCAVSQVQYRISVAADSPESTEILSQIANGRTGQLVVVLATRALDTHSTIVLDDPVQAPSVSSKALAYA